MSGSLPQSTDAIESMVLASPANASFSGTLPSTVPPSVLTINLIDQAISGIIPHIQYAPELHSLTIQQTTKSRSNRISGTLPRHISIPNVEAISVTRCFISGTLPAVDQLSHLKVLWVNNNRFSGTLDELHINNTIFESLDIGSTVVSGTLPARVEYMPSVNYINARDAPLLSGTITQNFGQMSHMINILIWGTKLSGSLPESIGLMSTLGNFLAMGTRLSGSLPKSFVNVSALRTFDISDDFISGDLSNLALSHDITNLHIRWNRLSGSLISFKNAPNLTGVLLTGNQLSGTFPATGFVPTIHRRNRANGSPSKLAYLMFGKNPVRH